MAQLFQPTNIYPDMRGPVGNGILYEPDFIFDYPTIYVEWQVNGNTAMTAFQVDFYLNDGSGTLIYSTGKRTDNCPFYSIDQNGDIQLFYHYITLSDYTYPTPFYDIKNGQMVITQWWGDGASDYVVQASPSVYIVKNHLNCYVKYNGDYVQYQTITERSATFTGKITGLGDDGLAWIRWTLYGPSGEILKDTGKLYGSAELTFFYDGFFPGENYGIQLSAEADYGGEHHSTIWDFDVEYDIQQTNIEVTASKSCGADGSVVVRWPLVASIPLTSHTGFYSMYDKYFTLASDSTLSWTTSQTVTPTSSASKVIWRGTVDELNKTFLTINYAKKNGYDQSYSIKLRRYTWYGETLYEIEETFVYVDEYGQSTMHGTSYIRTENIGKLCVAQSTDFHMVCYETIGSDGVFPSEELYPSNSLYPGGSGGVYTTCSFSTQNVFGTSRIISVVLGPAAQTTDYVKITSNDIDEITVLNDYAAGNPIAFDAGTRFLVSPINQDFNAGSFPSGTSSNMKGLQLYRKHASKPNLELIKTLGITNTELYDCGVRSQQGPYSYYLFVYGSSTFTTMPSVSNEINPCFWDWIVLSCLPEGGNTYLVSEAFAFGKNLSSGSISNNNKPNIIGNFTRYPLVQMSQQDYKSGTLQSLIGTIDTSDGQNKYSDTIDLKEAIYKLSTTTNILFLKNRKGDLWMIRPAGDITMETMDNTKEQAQTVRFPWVEVGDATNVVLYHWRW